MRDKSKILCISLVLVQILLMLVLATACCEDDTADSTDADTDGDTDSDSDADSDADTDSDSDADTDSDSDADTDSDSDTDTGIDTGAEYIIATEGEECMGPALIHLARGICVRPTDPCVGGYPDGLDYKKLFPGGGLPVVVPGPGFGPVPESPDPQGNCEDGLLCCVNIDECRNFGEEIESFAVIDEFFTNIRCVDAGTCEDRNDVELEIGCPENQNCCINVSISL